MVFSGVTRDMNIIRILGIGLELRKYLYDMYVCYSWETMFVVLFISSPENISHWTLELTTKK